jgi:hypothetical protein
MRAAMVALNRGATRQNAMEVGTLPFACQNEVTCEAKRRIFSIFFPFTSTPNQ